MMVGPMMPLRGQIPIARGRIPPSVMGPIRPFPPRFIPPNVYRLGPPPNYSKFFFRMSYIIITVFKTKFFFSGFGPMF